MYGHQRACRWYRSWKYCTLILSETLQYRCSNSALKTVTATTDGCVRHGHSNTNIQCSISKETKQWKKCKTMKHAIPGPATQCVWHSIYQLMMMVAFVNANHSLAIDGVAFVHSCRCSGILTKSEQYSGNESHHRNNLLLFASHTCSYHKI